MQPLINLKQFLAVLLLLIIPAALLTAYFRNYEQQANGHEHSHTAGHMHGQPETPQTQVEPGTSITDSRIEAIEVQLKAVHIQLENIRMQLATIRKAVGAAKPPDHIGLEKKPEIVPQSREQVAPTQHNEPHSDGHAHKH